MVTTEWSMHIEIECLEQCDPCSSTWYSSFNVSCSWDMHTAYTLGMREGVWLLKEEDSDPGLSNLPCGVLIARSQTPPFGFTVIVEHKKKERNLSKMESHQVGVGYFHLVSGVVMKGGHTWSIQRCEVSVAGHHDPAPVWPAPLLRWLTPGVRAQHPEIQA